MKENEMKCLLKPVMDRFVHNGDVVSSKTGKYKIIAAYGDDGSEGCLLKDSVYVFTPNEIITDQEAMMIIRKHTLQMLDLDLKQWLQWRFAKINWNTPAHYDVARYKNEKNEYCYNEVADGFTEDKYLYEPSVPRKRSKKSPKNWYVESHQ